MLPPLKVELLPFNSQISFNKVIWFFIALFVVYFHIMFSEGSRHQTRGFNSAIRSEHFNNNKWDLNPAPLDSKQTALLLSHHTPVKKTLWYIPGISPITKIIS